MVLSDEGILKSIAKNEIEIEPLDIGPINEGMTEPLIKSQIEKSSQIQPASVDLKLGNKLLVYNEGIENIDIKNIPEPDEVREGNELVLKSGEFALASTKERIKIPNNIYAEIKGRSSIGRAGFHIHTAGWVDPGYDGQITLELVNHSPADITLYEDMRICQIIFGLLETPAKIGYGEQKDSKYQNQEGPTPSKIDKDFE